MSARVFWITVIAFYMLLCCGCATTEPVVVPKETLVTQQLNIDPRLLELCDADLAQLDGRTLMDVLRALDKSQRIHQCSYEKHKELADLIKKYLKTDTPVKLQSQ
jgi:hypothetical protein